MSQTDRDTPADIGVTSDAPSAATETASTDNKSGSGQPSATVPDTSTKNGSTAPDPRTTAADNNRSLEPRPSVAPKTRDGRWALVITTVLCVVFGTAGHLVLLSGWINRAPVQNDNLLPWQPVVGASLTAVAILSFGGFYYASLRARVAIMSSFLLTFLLLLTYVLTVREIQPTGDQPLVQALVDDFRVIVQTIVGFYFGTETVLSLTKIIRAPKEDPASVRRADRDLPAG